MYVIVRRFWYFDIILHFFSRQERIPIPFIQHFSYAWNFFIPFFSQIRRSFLEELGIHKNWSVVDMIFREFYTGSDEDLSETERKLLEAMFSSKSYVQREIEYGYTSKIGAVNTTALENWKAYFKKYEKYIVSGTHFANFAVQVRHHFT